VVVTRVGDLADLIEANGAGVVTYPRTEEFACGVLGLLENRELRLACGRRARSVAETTLAWPRVTEALEKFYQTVL
jgi:glycosyltransferase involved in cell wall biosynthesis